MRQPYRLESITLRDVGVFENTHFDFPPIKSAEADAEKAEIHIFTGPNGCGKSTLLYALAAVFDYSLMGSDLVRGRFRGEKSRVEVRFYSANTVVASAPASKEYSRTGKPEVYFTGHNIIQPYRNLGSQEFLPLPDTTPFAAFAYSGQRNENQKFFVSNIEEIKESPFKDALSFNKTVRPNVLAQWIANNRTKTALAKSDGGDESEIARYELALNHITSFIRQICELDIAFKLERKSLNVFVETDGITLDFNVLPDGLKSIISWVGDLARRLDTIDWEHDNNIFSQPIILFLDEVDIHLHPKWQRRILPAIQKLLPNAQVFVSTHSPFVVGSVEDAWVYRLPDPQRLVCRDPHIAEVIEPTESAGGKSYSVILEEIFEVKEQFDVETERQLEHFYQLRNAYLKDPQDIRALKACAEKVSEISEEVDAIILMEMRQIARLTKAK